MSEETIFNPWAASESFERIYFSNPVGARAYLGSFSEDNLKKIIFHVYNRTYKPTANKQELIGQLMTIAHNNVIN